MKVSQNLKTWIYRIKKTCYKAFGQGHKYGDSRFIDNSIGKECNLGSAKLKGNCNIGNRVRLIGAVTIGKYTTIGEGGVLYGGKVDVGNYCQFGPRIGIYSVNHPLNYITTYVNQNLFNGELKTLVETESVRIENDVWIGDGAIVLPGVTIGNGAIIGAGAVVVNDIESYSIAVGNPARIIRKRFPIEIVELLNNWQWWNLAPADLLKYKSVFFINAHEDHEELITILTDIIHEKGLADSYS